MSTLHTFTKMGVKVNFFSKKVTFYKECLGLSGLPHVMEKSGKFDIFQGQGINR